MVLVCRLRILYPDLMSRVTEILEQIDKGDSVASEQLLPLVYEELRKLASARLAQEKPGQTLQPTALVHEAYLRLVDTPRETDWSGRAHFFGAAAEAMRRILVDRARQKQTQKAGGQRLRFSLEEIDLAVAADSDRLIAIDDLLEGLAEESSDVAQLVKLRVFVGMTVKEAASALGISRATAFRHWTYARAWLRAELEDLPGDH